MQEKSYKVIELVGAAETSMEDAIQNAITRADQTLKILTGLKSSQRGGSFKGSVRTRPNRE